MENLAAHFQNSLFDSQIVSKLVQEFSSFSVEGELDKLAKERGLGGPRIGFLLKKAIYDIDFILI